MLTETMNEPSTMQQSVKPMSDSTPAPTKHVRLRETCDSCLLAKVKCSKTRPLCARCLANGAPCGYSPSSRAGRKKRNTNSVSLPASKSTSFTNVSDLSKTIHPPSTSYLSTPTTKDGDAFETPDFLPTPPFNGDFIDPFFPLSTHSSSPEFDARVPSPRLHSPMSPTFFNNSAYSHMPSFQSPLDMMPFGQPHQSRLANRPDLPTPDNSGRSSIHGQDMKQSCDCFAACLQGLQTLHNHSWLGFSTQQGGVPFDIVLAINRDAIDSCSAMLGCTKCISKSGNGVSTMLLATAIGKIISLYRAACSSRFGPGDPGSLQATSQLAFGAYMVTGEDRQLLEMEILLLELRKVESIINAYQERFCNAQNDNEESNLYNVLMTYLAKNLRHIFEFLHARKGGVCK